MGEVSIFYKIKQAIGRRCFIIFLWSINKTDEQYWDLIYWAEKANRENK